MAGLFSFFSVFFACFALSVPSPIGIVLSLVAAIATFPPFWKKVAEAGRPTFNAWRWAGAPILLFGALIASGADYSQTPAGIAVAEERTRTEQAAKEAETQALASADAEREASIASGEHCLSGWDGSLSGLKRAVRNQLRNPSSFEHVETVRSPVDETGTFGLIMTYRAENGFGGMNVEAIGVEVDASTCRFQRVSDEKLARRLASR